MRQAAKVLLIGSLAWDDDRPSHTARPRQLAPRRARSASELGRHFRSAQPTISKHLKVLEQAGLIERTVEGRVHLFRLRQKSLEDAEHWIRRQQVLWTGAVDQLEHLLQEPRDEA